MFSVWTSVKVKSDTHERTGEAGLVWKINRTKMPDHVVVKWDTDGTEETMPIVDLAELS